MNEEKSRTETLESEGWNKQFVSNEPRLSEAVQLYKESGFEVHLEPLPKEPTCESCEGSEEENECRVCFEGVEDQYEIIFTRPKEGKAESSDDLY